MIVLSNGEFYRVGGREPIKVDVRIITATHQNIEDLVKAGNFREDLFHRLNVIKLSLPKLNERKEDIPTLVKHFFQRSSDELVEEKKYLSAEVEDYFMTLSWPGNVRQLENTCRWLTVMSPTREVKLEDLPDDLKVENIEIAEISKLMNNSIRDLKFSFSNQMAEISAKFNIDRQIALLI